jgi:D-alanyl-D-alanine carboxypeptidase (penicillin-binding protein 5/6)
MAALALVAGLVLPGSAMAWSATPSVAAPAMVTPTDPTTGAPLCAVGDLTPITLPSTSPMPVRIPGQAMLGGESLSGNGLAVPAGSPALPTTLSATSWLVADLETGEVLGACGAHRYGVPASVQKLLLTATVMPKLRPTDTTVITDGDLDFEPGSSAVGLVKGGTYTVEELFLGLLLNSGNDAAQTLARLGGGKRGVAGTIADMNATAKRIGAWDTHAETPSGLDGPGQVTSAYDLALIFRECFQYPDFRRYLATQTARMPPVPPTSPEGFVIQNDNRLIYEYPGALGGKTGYTDLARHSYVGAAQRDGRTLVVSVLGAEVMPYRGWQQAASLLDWGFALSRGASVGHLVAKGEIERVNARTPSAQPSPITALSAESTGPSMLPVVGASAVGVALLVGGLAVLMARRRRPHP